MIYLPKNKKGTAGQTCSTFADIIILHKGRYVKIPRIRSGTYFDPVIIIRGLSNIKRIPVLYILRFVAVLTDAFLRASDNKQNA